MSQIVRSNGIEPDDEGRYVDYDDYMALRQDLITLVLRLLAEDENTFSPESLDVMNRYRKEVNNIITGPVNRFLGR